LLVIIQTVYFMKEKFFTAVIGLGAGLVIAAGIFFGPQLAGRFRQTTFLTPAGQNPPSGTPSPTPLDFSANAPISLTKPTETVVAASPVEIVGRTFPQSTVVVTSPAEEQVVQSDDQGNFKITLKIDEGENTLVAAVTDQRGNLKTAQKQIILEINE
jgi:hypothetical protein